MRHVQHLHGIACSSLFGSTRLSDTAVRAMQSKQTDRLHTGPVSWLQREVTLVKRNAFLYIFRFFLLTLIAIVVVSACFLSAISLCIGQSRPSSWTRQSAGSASASSV